MPRATRNTNARSGKFASAPAKSNTWWNTRLLTPRAAPNDSTTVAMSSSGATTARSTSAGMRKTMLSTPALITLEPPPARSCPTTSTPSARSAGGVWGAPTTPRAPTGDGGGDPGAGGGVGGPGRSVRRPPRPEDPAAAHDQQGRHQGDHGEQPGEDADGAGRPEPFGGV